MEDIKEEIIVKLQEQLGDEVELRRQEIQKTNGIVKDGVTVRYPGENVSPNIYLDDLCDMYLRGYSIENIVEVTVDKLREVRAAAPPVPEITAEEARKNLYCVVVSAADNEEMLKNVPHQKLEDLAVVPRFRVGEDGSFLVTNEICSNLQLTESEVMEMARANTARQEFKLQTMGEIMTQMMIRDGMPPEFLDEIKVQFEECPLWVLTNSRGVDGAAVLTCPKEMKEAYSRIGDAYYVLPSSRHEVILCPKSFGAEPDELRSMVRSINASDVVADIDRLSDSVYLFNGRKLTMVEEQVQERTMAEEQVQERTRHHSR